MIIGWLKPAVLVPPAAFAGLAPQQLEAILAHRDHIVAVDLAGDETNFPAAWFIEHFKKVRDAGLHVTVHAGAADGPPSVWSAIRDLGAERIETTVCADNADAIRYLERALFQLHTVTLSRDL